MEEFIIAGIIVLTGLLIIIIIITCLENNTQQRNQAILKERIAAENMALGGRFAIRQFDEDDDDFQPLRRTPNSSRDTTRRRGTSEYSRQRFSSSSRYQTTPSNDFRRRSNPNPNLLTIETPSFEYFLHQAQFYHVSKKFSALSPLLPTSWEERNTCVPDNWGQFERLYPLGTHRLVNLDQISMTELNKEILKINFKNKLNIVKIERVQNSILWMKYQLKKAELEKLYENTKEFKLFHGTKSENIDSICSNGFNWRKYGSNTGHKFGQGISFSLLASYASHYSDKNVYFVNKIILARVLMCEGSVGDESTVLPHLGGDFTAKSDYKVIVKYDDDTCYPEYVITYTGVLPDMKDIYLEKKLLKLIRQIQELNRRVGIDA